MRDLKSDVDFQTSIAPAVINATTNGTGVNLLGYEAAVILINVGIVTDGTHLLTLQESADNVNWTNVAAADQINVFPANLVTSTNIRLGYIGSKQYIRVVSTVTPGSTGGAYAAAILRGYSAQRPLA